MNKSKNRKHKIEIAIHGLIWVVLFYIPVALSSGAGIGLKEIALFYWLQLFFMAVLFYTNFLWIVDQFLFKQKKWLFLVFGNLFLIAILYWLKFEIFTSFLDQPGKGHHGPPLALVWYSEFLVYLIPIVFAIAIKSGKRMTDLQVYQAEAENTKLQAELQTLKYQLQPHFFFNSLNNIYSMIETEPEKARKSIHSLSKLMRHLLHASNMSTISLKEEIGFLTKYIALMKVRLTNSTRVEVDFPKKIPEIQIAPLLFISLVENAFKHGVSARHSSEIYFYLEVTDDHHVIFTSFNQDFSQSKTDLSSSGIGLENLRKRLHLLYPDKHHFVTQLNDNQFKAILEINLNPKES